MDALTTRAFNQTNIIAVASAPEPTVESTQQRKNASPLGWVAERLLRDKGPSNGSVIPWISSLGNRDMPRPVVRRHRDRCRTEA